ENSQKIRVPVMDTYEVEEPVWDERGEPLMVGTGKFNKRNRPKLNPDYDSGKAYTPRGNRPEWNAVGLLGQLPLKKGQPTATTWVKIKNISKDIDLWLVK
ncbi:MAG: peptidase G2 autoproteolytic cleavage domain-containing protein, partial [Leptospirales bacterium]